LKDACATFTPAFAPADTSLTIANFTTFIGQIGAKNTLVESKVASYSTAAGDRVALVKNLRDVLTQALGYLESNKAWKSQAATARAIVVKFRGTRPPAAPTPPPAPGETPTVQKKRSQGQQAYVELAAHLEQFVGVCTATPGYSPTATEITLSSLNGNLSAFKSLKGGISTLEQQISTARKDRFDAYFEGENCLQKKFQAVKKAVKGQYGLKSAQYESAKGIVW
jgi:hypothetical protein